LEILKDYAGQRLDPTKPVYRLSGGSGSITPNKQKRAPQHPDYVGRVKTAGRLYSLVGWRAKDAMSVNFRLHPLPPLKDQNDGRRSSRP
jgi:hypothetical protein